MRDDGGSAFLVAVDVDDDDLATTLVRAIRGRSGLRLATTGEAADAAVAERRASAGDAGGINVVSGPVKVAFPHAVDPEIVASAAHLVAAGYALSERAPVTAGDEPDSHRTPLTPREYQVLALMVDGGSNKSIARALGVSPSTAKFHVAAVLGKLGARNRSDAVAIALRDGLVAL
jgi:DNA-binding CsgD family transcriptional regulator